MDRQRSYRVCDMRYSCAAIIAAIETMSATIERMRVHHTSMTRNALASLFVMGSDGAGI